MRQRAALAAAALSESQVADVLAAYSGAVDRVAALQTEVGRLQEQLKQVREGVRREPCASHALHALPVLC